MYAWQGLMYLQDGVISVAAVARTNADGPWSAYILTTEERDRLLGDAYLDAASAQRAVEEWFAR